MPHKEDKREEEEKQRSFSGSPNPDGPGFIISQADVPELLDQDISWGITEHKTPNPKRGDMFVDVDNSELQLCFADGTWTAIAVGASSTLSIKESGVQIGGSDIATLDFGLGFDLTESPDTEINITLDHSELAFPTWSDTGITGVELETLSAGGTSNADELHTHPAIVGNGGTGVTDHGALTGLADDDHPQYAARFDNEIIGGQWVFSNIIWLNAGAAPTFDPPEDFIFLRLIKDGTNLILRAYGPTGTDDCDICTFANVAVVHTNTLALNWVE